MQEKWEGVGSFGGFFSKQIERGERDNSGKRLFKGSEVRTSKEKRKKGLGWCPVLRDRELGEIKKTKGSKRF